MFLVVFVWVHTCVISHVGKVMDYAPNHGVQTELLSVLHLNNTFVKG